MKKKGCYLLVLFREKERQIQVGKLGKFIFKGGFYCYTGSAMNNLQSRIERHLRTEKKHHWHIDYLRSKAEVIRVMAVETEEKMECRLNQSVAQIADAAPVRKFGSTDCKCYTHLHYFEKDPFPKLEIIHSQLKIKSLPTYVKPYF